MLFCAHCLVVLLVAGFLWRTKAPFTLPPLSLCPPLGNEPLFDHIRGERERSVVLLTFPLAFDSVSAADQAAQHQQEASVEFLLFLLCFSVQLFDQKVPVKLSRTTAAFLMSHVFVLTAFWGFCDLETCYRRPASAGAPLRPPLCADQHGAQKAKCTVGRGCRCFIRTPVAA